MGGQWSVSFRASSDRDRPSLSESHESGQKKEGVDTMLTESGGTRPLRAPTLGRRRPPTGYPER